MVKEKKFSELVDRVHFRSGVDNFLDLYKLLLPHCEFGFWRASAYFRSESFAKPAAFLGIKKMIEAGGDIRLITSVNNLLKVDVAAAKKGYASRKKDVNNRKNFLDTIGVSTTGAELIEKLIQYDLMDWKVAWRGQEPKNQYGLFHEKTGLFMKNDDDYYFFNGSLNQTINGLYNSQESIDIRHSSSIKSENMVDIFRQNWIGNSDGKNDISSELIHLAADNGYIKYRQKIEVMKNGGDDESTDDFDEEYEVMTENLGATLRKYQRDALNTFIGSGGKGILAMATGTGKTRTANAILVNLWENDLINTAIVCVKDLVILEQWRVAWAELNSRWGLNPSFNNIWTSYGGNDDTKRYLNKPDKSLLVIGFVSPKKLSMVLNYLRLDNPEALEKMLLIHDEVHGLGSDGGMTHLLDHTDGIKYTLGLSATWERYNEEETDFIANEMGPGIKQPVFEYSLKNAIEDSWLVEFDYDVIEYERSQDDATEWAKYADAPGYLGERVYKASMAKVEALREWIREDKPRAKEKLLNKCVFFCEMKVQGDAVAKVLMDELQSTTHHSYFSEDADKKLHMFEDGSYTTLITAGRLDQGWDNSSLKHVVLLSSDAEKRSTVQRIGRMIRTDPEDDNKRGYVLDFIRIVRDDGFGPENKNHYKGRGNKKKICDGKVSESDASRQKWLQQLSKTKNKI